MAWIDTVVDETRLPGLAGKAAIVTGTSRGIGCGIAWVLARQGMRLVLAARTEDAGRAFADRLRDQGAEATFIPADLAEPDDAARVFQAALDAYGGVDLLVNNAAITRSKAFLDTDPATWARNYEANGRMVYHLSVAVARHLAERGRGGSIVHISSVGGLRGHRGMAAYDASKGAIDALTRTMAAELAPHKVRVNTVAPGATWRGLEPRDEESEPSRLYIPLARQGMPQEMGLAVAFLASDAAAYITGQVLYVDGGLTAQLSPPGIFV